MVSLIYKTMPAQLCFVCEQIRFNISTHHVFGPDLLLYSKRKPYCFGLVCIMYRLEGILFHIFSVYDFIERYGVRDINKLQEAEQKKSLFRKMFYFSHQLLQTKIVIKFLPTRYFIFGRNHYKMITSKSKEIRREKSDSV